LEEISHGDPGASCYFDRSRLDADLKRIQAFYADHGYPDARVTSVDVNVNTQRDAVNIRVTISEGDPVKVVAVEFTGFDVIPPDPRDELKQKAPLRVGPF
jgi:outer membrane protein insertion porin family